MSDVPSNLIPTRITQLPVAPVADEDSLMMIVYEGVNYQIRVGDLLAVAGVPTTRQVIAGTSLTGGGQLSSNVTLSVANGGIGTTQLASTGVTAGEYGSATSVPVLTVDAKGRITAATTIPVTVSGYVPTSRQVIAGTGLTGGGSLNSDVTISASLSDATPQSGYQSGSAGTGTSSARSDHKHPAVELGSADQVDGILGLSNGGTARSLVPDEGAIIWCGADGLYVGPVGEENQVLISNGSGEYKWGAALIVADQPANYIYASPESGGEGTTSFRPMVNADLPDTGVVANTYGSSSALPTVTVNSKGVITSASTVSLSTVTTGKASNVVGGAANRIVYNTNTDTTGFITAPSVANTFLEWSGTGFQWSANPLGTVTSVAMTVPTGLSISGSPITTNGTLALSLTSGYSIPTTASQANWDTAYTDRLKWDGGSSGLNATTGRASLSAAKSGANSDITSMSGITGGIATPEYIDFDTVNAVSRATGRLWWDASDGIQTLNLGMAGSNATMQIGEEIYFRIKASADITEGQVVMFTGSVGASGALTGAPATGITASTASYIMGVATESILANNWGYVTQFGLVRGIDTTGGAEAWTNGQILYYNPAVAGGLTKTVPTAPNAKVQVAAVVYASSGGAGSLFIRPTFGGALGQYEGDVNISSVTGNDLLMYNGTNSRWQNTAASSITIGTATNVAGGAANKIVYNTGSGATSFINAPTVANTYLEWSGSAFQWSANPLGTVTSVAMSVPTGLTISGSPITSSGTLALTLTSGYSIPTTASQTNWDTAYSVRQQWTGGSTNLVAATGRTSLGATTLGSNLFTITNPSAITFPRFNADNTVSALDAATFRTAIGAGTSSTTGTVTSVAMTVPTGLTISGSPITSSGTLALTFTSGYSIPTTASQTNWDSAYTQRLQWDGGSTNLVAATGRTSLGATTLGSNIFTIVNPSAITFPRFNADNTISALDAATFKTAIGAGTVTSVAMSGGTTGITFSGSPITTSGTITMAGTLAIANGGTNGSATPTAGGMPYGTGTAYAFTAAGTAGQFMKSNGASAPTWGNIDGGTF